MVGWLARVRSCRGFPDESPEQIADDPGDETALPSVTDDPWEAFEPDDDYDPQPEPGDFWMEE